jgi:hypothetical protein
MRSKPTLSNKVAATSLAAFASLWLVSCAGGSVDCEIDAVFTQSQGAEIQRAADVWNSLSVRPITFAPQGQGDWLILPASVTLNRLGYAEPKRKLIRINPVTPDNQIYAVALHEFGHAIGLGHVKHGVMDPDHQTMAFSAEDIAECRRVGACTTE